MLLLLLIKAIVCYNSSLLEVLHFFVAHKYNLCEELC